MKPLLQELTIRNFAIIDQISISFSEGLTVLTGETGAGKSIIIDAVHLLVGAAGPRNTSGMARQKRKLKVYFSSMIIIPAMQKLPIWALKSKRGCLFCAVKFQAAERASAGSTESL